MSSANAIVFDDELQPPPPYDGPSMSLAPRFKAEDFADDNKKHILLAGSGSTAMSAFPKILSSLRFCTDISIRVVLTKEAAAYLPDSHQYNLYTLRQFYWVEGVYTDHDLWAREVDDIVLEHELSRWVDILVIAPLDANTLTKIANGAADNLLTSLVRGFDHLGISNPITRLNRPKWMIFAAALNRSMVEHPITKQQIETLRDKWRVTRSCPPKPPALQSSITLHFPWASILPPMEKDEDGESTLEGGHGMMLDWRKALNIMAWRIDTYDDPLYPQPDADN